MLVGTLVVQEAVQMSISNEAVRESAGTNRRAGQELQSSSSSLQRVLTEDLHAYKVLLTQELNLNDHAQLSEFVELYINKWMMIFRAKSS